MFLTKNYETTKEIEKCDPHTGEKSRKQKLPVRGTRCQIKQRLQKQPFLIWSKNQRNCARRNTGRCEDNVSSNRQYQ